MEEIGAYEAKTHLGQLLDRAGKGEEFVITKHGRAVARLVPLEKTSEQARHAISTIETLRKGITTGGTSLKDMIEEGRS